MRRYTLQSRTRRHPFIELQSLPVMTVPRICSSFERRRKKLLGMPYGKANKEPVSGSYTSRSWMIPWGWCSSTGVGVCEECIRSLWGAYDPESSPICASPYLWYWPKWQSASNRIKKYHGLSNGKKESILVLAMRFSANEFREAYYCHQWFGITDGFSFVSWGGGGGLGEVGISVIFVHTKVGVWWSRITLWGSWGPSVMWPLLKLVIHSSDWTFLRQNLMSRGDCVCEVDVVVGQKNMWLMKGEVNNWGAFAAMMGWLSFLIGWPEWLKSPNMIMRRSVGMCWGDGCRTRSS